MGEGWGDPVNAFMWDDPVFSEYPSGNTTSGLRIYDMSNSPADYSDLCDVGNLERLRGPQRR